MKHDAPATELLKPAEAAARLRISRSHLVSLVEREALPCLVLSAGPGGRRTLRFQGAELDAWLSGRRARQVNDWTRYQRKVTA